MTELIEWAKSRRSGFGKLDHRLLRAIVLLAVLSLGAYIAFFRLGAADWNPDEPTYRDAGLEYVRDHDFRHNLQHPFLVKYILGVTQVLFHSSDAGVVRIPAATAALLTGLILFAFAQRVAGYWTGTLALALWTISPLTLTFGRVAILEAFLACFSALALYLGWRWAESGGWGFAAAAGVAVGLATASKPVGILFLPAILLVGLLKIDASRRFVFQSLLVGLSMVAAALATYIPVWRQAFSMIRYMFEFQSHHSAKGHAVDINGILYKFPPWWAHLWWQWEFYGTLAILSLAVAVVIALVRHRPLELYLLTAALVPFLFLSFYIRFKLYSYFYEWQVPLVLLLALAAGRLAQRGIAGGLLAVALLAPFAYLGVGAIQAPSQIQPDRYAAVAEYLQNTGHDRATILVWGYPKVFKGDLPEARILQDPEAAQGEQIGIVLVDDAVIDRRPEPSIEDYLTTNSDRFELSQEINEIEVYTRKPTT